MFFKLCSDHLSIEAIPRKPVRVDLPRLKSEVLSNLQVLLWTPQFVVLRNREGHEVTLRRDGRMIIRKAPSELAAERTANDMMNAILALSLLRLGP